MVSVNNGHVRARRYEYTVRLTQGTNQILLNFEDKEEFDFFCTSFANAFGGAGEAVELYWIRNEEVENQSEEPVAAF